MPKKKISIEHIRHSLAHILAMAVLERWPSAKLGVGPVIETGCYYDFELPEAVKPEDLPDIEKRMKKIIGRNLDFSGRQVSFPEARVFFNKKPAVQNRFDRRLGDVRHGGGTWARENRK